MFLWKPEFYWSLCFSSFFLELQQTGNIKFWFNKQLNCIYSDFYIYRIIIFWSIMIYILVLVLIVY